ncbi:MAG: transcriptional regulator, MarR family [Caulobacter sp.]|nr:transcriptional regulator, MarR family [Caulobacter sp.]
MDDWSDTFHAAFLRLNGYLNRPDLDASFLARAGVKLDRALFPLLTRIGLFGPIGVVELANLIGRNHSTVSRQATKLESLGLVERHVEDDDQRVRRLRPTEAGQVMLDEFRQARRRFMDRNFTDWTEADRAALAELTARMATRMGELLK